MRQRSAISALLAAAVLAVGGSAAFAQSGPGADGSTPGAPTLGPAVIFKLAENAGISDGNPEGVAYDRRTGTFFVSRVTTGAIYRGMLASPDAELQPFIAGTAPTANEDPLATGLKVRGSRLYVAGATTGLITVYDIATAQKLATFDTRGDDTTSPTLVNDLVVTEDGDIYATDSFRPFIYHVPARAVSAGSGTVEAISVASKIPYLAGQFNLNGIVEDDGDLIVVQSATGKLFRVRVDGGDLDGIREIAVSGGPLVGGDGLLLDKGRLIVVQGSADGFPNGVLTFVKLRGNWRRGSVDARGTDPSLAGPSTIAKAADRYLVVNAHFGSPPPFTVSSLVRGLPVSD